MLFLKFGGVPVACFDDRICRGFPLLSQLRPRAASVEMLAEEARHVLSGRGELGSTVLGISISTIRLARESAVRASK